MCKDYKYDPETTPNNYQLTEEEFDEAVHYFEARGICFEPEDSVSPYETLRRRFTSLSRLDISNSTRGVPTIPRYSPNIN